MLLLPESEGMCDFKKISERSRTGCVGINDKGSVNREFRWDQVVRRRVFREENHLHMNFHTISVYYIHGEPPSQMLSSFWTASLL